MVGAIFCNVFIKDMSKTTEAMALNSKIADLEKEIVKLQFNLKQTGIEMREKETKINNFGKYKQQFIEMTKMDISPKNTIACTAGTIYNW